MIRTIHSSLRSRGARRHTMGAPRRLGLVAAALLLTAAISACGGDDDAAEPAGTDPATTDATEEPSTSDGNEAPAGELVVGEALPWMTWDPLEVVRSGYDLAWMRPVYEPLFEVNPDLSLESTLLSDWTLTNEGMDLTLVEGVTFHDGTALDAEALKYNLERYRDTPGPSQGLFATVANVSVVDPLNVRVSFSEPTPHFPFIMARESGILVSPTAAEAGTLSTQPVGTGPYTLNVNETQADAKAVFDVWDGYRDPSLQHIRRITIVPQVYGPEPFSAGDLDISYFVPPQRSAMEGIGEVASEPNTSGSVLSFLDRGPGGIFEDVNVRRAVAAAIDRAALNQAIGDAGDPRTVPVTGDEYGASDDLIGQAYDPDAVASLLADAGAEGLTFTIPIYPANQALAEALQAILRESGIEMQLEQITGSIYAECSSGRYEACVLIESSTHPAQMHDLLIDGEALLNPSGIVADEVAAAAEVAFAEPDLAAAESLWNDYFMAVFNDDVAMTYLVRVPARMAYNPDRVSTPNLTFVSPTAVDYRGLTLVD